MILPRSSHRDQSTIETSKINSFVMEVTEAEKGSYEDHIFV